MPLAGPGSACARPYRDRRSRGRQRPAVPLRTFPKRYYGSYWLATAAGLRRPAQIFGAGCSRWRPAYNPTSGGRHGLAALKGVRRVPRSRLRAETRARARSPVTATPTAIGRLPRLTMRCPIGPCRRRIPCIDFVRWRPRELSRIRRPVRVPMTEPPCRSCRRTGPTSSSSSSLSGGRSVRFGRLSGEQTMPVDAYVGILVAAVFLGAVVQGFSGFAFSAVAAPSSCRSSRRHPPFRADDLQACSSRDSPVKLRRVISLKGSLPYIGAAAPASCLRRSPSISSIRASFARCSGHS